MFITGTDTGVGKTFVAVGLLKALKEQGYNVCPMKPLETGCRFQKGKLIPEDTLKLIKAAGVDEPLDLINPYRFRKPFAPAIAAELEGVTISKRKIFSAFKQLSKKYDVTIVEGAGGIMVPLYKKYLFIDLIKDLNLPVVIVSRPGLGTINHTLLTIEAARSRGIDIIGVVINCSAKIKKDLSVRTNPEVIEKLGGAPVLCIVPHSENPSCGLFQPITEKILLALSHNEWVNISLSFQKRKGMLKIPL
ncbi:MAG: dethiobiotin synthase [Nitrospirae bacterium]|nr:dethiobiotin synthase [Nitrospirota bacterium]